MRCRPFWSVAAIAWSAAVQVPAVAHASTLTFVSEDVVELRAAAGEVNVVRLSGDTLSDAAGLTVVDELPAGCSQPGPTEVTCSSWPSMLDAELGDMDDSYDIPTAQQSVVDGGPGADVLRTGALDDVVRGGAGSDFIDVREGADDARGGDGDDHVETSMSEGPYYFGDGLPDEGDDRLYGEAGSDTLVSDRDFAYSIWWDTCDLSYVAGIVLDGGEGDDVFVNGFGDHTLVGGAGRDTADYRNHEDADVSLGRYDLTGATLSGMEWRPSDGCYVYPDGPERDRISPDVEVLLAGDTDDVIIGNALANRLDGGGGNDRVSGRGGADELIGGGQDDVLDGGDGADSLAAGEGDDALKGGAGGDVFDGGGGLDRVLYSGRSAPVTVTIDGVADDGATGEHDTVGASVEQVYGGNADDRLTGSPNADTLVGSQGADALMGGAGGDLLFGQGGDDNVFGGAGDDRVDGGFGSDRLRGEAGADGVWGGPGADFLYGGDGDDWLHDRHGHEDGFDCGAGIDRYTADAIDRRVRCETPA